MGMGERLLAKQNYLIAVPGQRISSGDGVGFGAKPNSVFLFYLFGSGAPGIMIFL